ncbi:ATP-binding protein [Spirochaeta africana]|uniref:4Fe-4S ferredoxin-type domain-containing protein n=1 Tax=Spirochaeta africana (strain ATCC 700263 / DSM 8902 / Z-7692) TaxID=889378 RepID=H9UL88_SPIAZ|nr:4Fe-4S binding protein [Spirochaeta africana]AFG38281.1 hypothetical protein Spiaf_2245 [Spirochaeta africana DSM 8902]
MSTPAVREIIEIDEDLCVGCGNCVPSCHQGALQIIDGKARLISDLMCEGIGVCVGTCPTGAMRIERRPAEPYDEIRVMEKIAAAGPNVIKAHLEHLQQHRQDRYLAQALEYLAAHDLPDPLQATDSPGGHPPQGGCPGAAARTLGAAAGSGHPAAGTPAASTASATPAGTAAGASATPAPPVAKTAPGSELRQWPVQLHLLNPAAGYLQHADLLLAADCSAFASGDFHDRFLRGKALAIACPKLDDGQDIYLHKLIRMIEDARINTLTVLIMEVPCCSGLLRMAQAATAQAARKVPVKCIVLSLEGEVIQEDWV